MKPDWKDAPKWANYLVMEPNGTWWWFQEKPMFFNKREGVWSTRWYGFWDSDGIREIAFDPRKYSEDSLEMRPFNLEKLK
jgi:hypothetical protein